MGKTRIGTGIELEPERTGTRANRNRSEPEPTETEPNRTVGILMILIWGSFGDVLGIENLFFRSKNQFFDTEKSKNYEIL